MHIERGYKRFGSGITACSSRAQLQLIALARASWRVARLALSTRGERKFAGANWCQVSLHCQLRITTHGIQHGMAVPLLDYTPPPLFTS